MATQVAACGAPLSRPPERAMRRTWKDVARTAGIEKVVRKAVSGTYTDAMEGRYSTATAGEKRKAVAKVVSINTAPERAHARSLKHRSPRV